MTPNSDKAKGQGRPLSDDFKRKVVEAVDARGDATLESVLEGYGVNKSSAYEWRRRIRLGLPLDGRKPRIEAQQKRARERRAPGSIAKSVRNPGVLMRAQQEHAPPQPLHVEVPSMQARTERDELVLLRAENQRLKAVVAQLLELR